MISDNGFAMWFGMDRMMDPDLGLHVEIKDDN